MSTLPPRPPLPGDEYDDVPLEMAAQPPVAPGEQDRLAAMRRQLSQEWEAGKRAGWKGTVAYWARKLAMVLWRWSEIFGHWWLRRWRKGGFFKKLFLLAITVTVALFLLGSFLGGSKRVLGLQDGATIHHWHANKPMAKTLDAIYTNATNTSMQATSKQITASWFPDKGFLWVRPTTGPALIIEQTGQRWQQKGTCWQPDGVVAEVTVQDLLPPLDPTTTTWRSRQGNRLFFTATQFGTWGNGAGNITVNHNKITKYSFTPEDGDTFVFTVRPVSAETAPTLTPCS